MQLTGKGKLHDYMLFGLDCSRHGSASSSRQMTIFYGGQAHVFDDVHPNKVCCLIVSETYLIILFNVIKSKKKMSLSLIITGKNLFDNLLRFIF